MTLLPPKGTCFQCGHDHGEGLGSPSEIALMARIKELEAQLAAAAAPANDKVEGWVWLTHPHYNEGKPIPVQKFEEDGVLLYRPFNLGGVTFEWDERGSEWQEVAAAPQAPPVNAEALHAECKRVAHNAIHDAIYKIADCEPVKDAVRDALDSIDLSEYAAPVAKLVDKDVRMDVVRQSYGWTIGTDGQLHGLIAGDMGYEPAGIKLDADTMQIWQLGLKAAGIATTKTEQSQSHPDAARTQRDWSIAEAVRQWYRTNYPNAGAGVWAPDLAEIIASVK